MEKVFVLQNAKIRQDSVFDMSDFYKMLFRWFENRDYSFYEKEYTEIEETKGKVVQIFWTANKSIDEYLQFGYDLSFNVVGLKPVEIEKGGLKIKSHAATVEIRMSAYVIKDPKGEWSKSGFDLLMRKFYERFIARKRYNQLFIALARESGSLLDEIRAFLSLHVF